MKNKIADTLNMAVSFHQAGRLTEAQELYEQILNISPRNHDALHLSGMISFQNGSPERAIQLIDQSLSIHPSAQVYCNLGVVLQATGKLNEAEKAYRQSLQMQPREPDTLFNLANVLKSKGDLDEAIRYYLEALTINTRFTEAFYNLGNTYREKNEIDKAIECYTTTIRLKPNHIDALSNLGSAFQEKSSLPQAAECYMAILSLNPALVEAYFHLGNIYTKQYQFDQAITSYQRAIDIEPTATRIHNACGIAFLLKKKFEDAEKCFKQVISMDPSYIEAYCNLGTALSAQNKCAEALALLTHALSSNPDIAKAQDIILGTIYSQQGNHSLAIRHFRQAMTLNPDNPEIHSNLIFAMDMSNDIHISELQHERKSWANRFADHLHVTKNFPNLRDVHRKLRVGYVSADFRSHSAANVFTAMLTQYDPIDFELFAYSNNSLDDEYTQLMKSTVGNWRDISKISDEDAASKISADKIDILVDLSGFSEGNRLQVFARKPAPIQITAWGYIGGTGMNAMDYFFADRVVIPPEETPLYAEEIIYLPNVVCYFPFHSFPPVNELPALSSKRVVFGSFNRLTKVTRETFGLWSRVLSALPNSTMIIKTTELDSPEERERLFNIFYEFGISRDRITLYGKTSWGEHMLAFNQVDISLDPFPHGGGVTTLEGVMMGVPVVTLRWPTLAGRLSASQLTALGLVDWIAETPEQYIDIAVKKASDLVSLNQLRNALRESMLHSLVGDYKAYTKTVESQYRALWQRWCEK